LSELISIKSLTGKEDRAQKNIANKMKEIGLQVDQWKLNLDELRKHPDFSMEVERTQGIGVVGTLGENQEGNSLILNGHIDVVPPGDKSNWKYPQWKATIEKGKVYGRGAVDMKGGLCSALFALKAIQDSGIKLKGKVFLESVVGEEDGGIGTLATILRGYTAHGAVVMEPTELKIAPAQAGALCFRIIIHGKSAHACVREEGVSTIDKFIPVYTALTNLEKERNSKIKDPLFSRYSLPIPLNLGTLKAGNWTSTVPETLVLEGRYGVGVEENIEDAKKLLEKTIANVVEADPWLKQNNLEFEWWGGQFKPAIIPIDSPIVKAVKNACIAITNKQPAYEGMTYGSDMRHLVNLGDTPTVLFGPGDVRTSHRPDEFISIQDIQTTTKILTLLIIRFCGI
jgi:acetylornithine deacetylase